jgi:hypothetical protein
VKNEKDHGIHHQKNKHQIRKERKIVDGKTGFEK